MDELQWRVPDAEMMEDSDEEEDSVPADPPEQDPGDEVHPRHARTQRSGSGAGPGTSVVASNWEYRVVPFKGQVKHGLWSREGMDVVARQLGTLISEHAAQGWEFRSVEKIGLQVSPGCIASLFGREGYEVNYDQIVFRRPRR